MFRYFFYRFRISFDLNRLYCTPVLRNGFRIRLQLPERLHFGFESFQILFRFGGVQFNFQFGRHGFQFRVKSF